MEKHILRIISASDIQNAVGPLELMEAATEALLIAEGTSFSMPKRLHADFCGNTLLAMPCFTEAAIGTKIVTVFPENRSNSLPVINGVMILGDADTGIPKALLDGATLTAVRTGAVGGVAAKLLNAIESPKLGVIGCGVQGQHQSLSIKEAVDAKEVWLFDLDNKNTDATAALLENRYGELKVKVADTPEALVENSDIVVTATSSTKPVVPDDKELLKNKTFIAIGSFKPEMRELPDSVFGETTRIFVDTHHAIEESGDLAIPIESGLIEPGDIHTLGKVLNGSMPRPSLNETTVFKSVGMALFDVCVANLIYKKAVADGIGVQVEL